jgi:hypothetical protein
VNRRILYALLLALPHMLMAGTPPLQEQDVVRWVMDGVDTETILERLSTVETTGFQLDREMLTELKAAGLSDRILEAMQAAQQRSRSATGEPAENRIEWETSITGMVLGSRGDSEAPPTLYHSAVFTREDLVLAVDPKATLRPAIEDLIFFVGCRRDTHVPDQWRTRTILGDDYHFVPRHRLLWAQSSAEILPGSSLPLKKKLRAALMGARPTLVPTGLQTQLTGANIKGRWFFKLVLPERIELQTVATEEGHDLFAGIAVRYKGRVLAIHLREPTAFGEPLLLGGWADRERTDALLQW